MPAKISQAIREEQLRSLPNIRFIRWVDGYKNAHSKAQMLCADGHEWSATVNCLVNRSNGCPTCSGNVKFNESYVISLINSAAGVRFVEWDGAYENKDSSALLECPRGHKWVSRVTNIIHKRCGCPVCAGNTTRSQHERELQLKSLAGVTFVGWVAGYSNSNSRAIMRCTCGHERSSSVNNLLNGLHGCPHCAGSGFDPSKPATLYAIRSESGCHIKIGISNHYARRLSKLRRDTPFNFAPVALLHLDDGATVRDLERTFHSEFESSGFGRFDGASEWLKFDPHILDLMQVLGGYTVSDKKLRGLEAWRPPSSGRKRTASFDSH